MSPDFAHAEVRLWDRTVGALVETDTGRVVFEYDPEFTRSGLEISPIHLPLERRGPIVFDELRAKPAFDGLPGVVADALPDAFGNRVIRAYFGARGHAERALSPVQRLLYIGERAIGALTFHPAEQFPSSPADMESLEIAALVRDARRLLEEVDGTPEIAVPEIYRVGSSAGGMRPKAVVLHDPVASTVRSAYATPRPGEVPTILKFDGVGPSSGLSGLSGLAGTSVPADSTASSSNGGDVLSAPQPFNRVEVVYAQLARAAGIDMADVQVLHAGEHRHLLIRRFDLEEPAGATGTGTETKTDIRRLHQHTLGGALHVDYNDPGASSYEEYLRTILRLGMPPAAVQEGFRRMAFNVMAINQDDHVKNLSFHMAPDGNWRLTPAYDVTFARGQGFTKRHQMRINDKVAGITRADLLAVAHTFAIKRPERILQHIDDALDGWDAESRRHEVPEAVRVEVGTSLRQRRQELA